LRKRFITPDRTRHQHLQFAFNIRQLSLTLLPYRKINATFYRSFEPGIAKKWSDAVENTEFEVAIKANQVFCPRSLGKAE
jgi:uncharacterized protein YecE (DUF72 family)